MADLIVILILFAISCLIALKFYAKLSSGVCKCRTDLSGKTIVITGGNRGIGKEIAKKLAERNGRVIIGCRNMKAAQIAIQQINPNDNLKIVAKYLDLSSLESIRSFANDITDNESNISILICNAANVPDKGKHLTIDGLEEQFCVNHFGHFLLVNLLMAKLIESSPTRIIVQSSILHHFGNIDFDNLNMEKQVVDSSRVYWNTKLANILFVRQLAKRMPKSVSVTVNACHPGLVDTDIDQKIWYWNHVLRPLVYPLFAKSESEGAETAVHLALAPDLQDVSGKYFSDCRQTQPSSKCMDESVAQRLWNVSEQLTRAKFDFTRSDLRCRSLVHSRRCQNTH